MVNIFRQDVEAKNKATGENKATRFPIPNIKGGKRQLNIAPATEAQREYNDYLIARMEAFNQLKTKEERIAYAKIDNPLWVLTDAKKPRSMCAWWTRPHSVTQQESGSRRRADQIDLRPVAGR